MSSNNRSVRAAGDGAWLGMKGRGFKARPSTYKLSAAPTRRARCRVCKGLVGKGELRLEACVFVMPGRRTVLVTHAACVNAAQAKDVMSVYRSVAQVPVGVGTDAACVDAARSQILRLLVCDDKTTS